MEMETLPAGPNWNWQETTIGKIIIEQVDNDIKVLRIRELDSKYISQDLVNNFYDYIMKIKQGEIKLNFDEFFESNENENILSKVYVCCLFGDKRFYDILRNITQYVGLLVPDGHIAEMQDSYIDYLNRSN